MTQPSMRATTLSCALFAAVLITGCSGGGSSALPSPVGAPAVVSQTLAYSAIGASDAAGYGATVTCNSAENPVAIALPACPGGTGYVPKIATALTTGGTTIVLNDLGITGAVIAPDIAALQVKYGPTCAGGTNPGDFATNEVPHLTGNERLVTIFAGANDTNVIVNAAVCQYESGALTSSAIPAYLTQEIMAFGNDFSELVAAVRQKAPNAQIVVANLPNFADLPFSNAAAIAPAKSLLQTVSVGIDTSVYQAAASSGIPEVDLLCAASSYTTANFSADGFHPNDAGYLTLAQAFIGQINAATPAQPATSCSYMNVLGTNAAATHRGLRTLPLF